ncbi:TetR family transcriptional regulator C-terminal domain-containing protein [Streptomyces sp. NPDC020571]|uniref:TetR family transcriptional regulator C-terminal domain-containing protein n=1 Tax=Streptomyces sp. NPDC020571 TaxID=3365079 RepID=UPI0037AA6B5D
MFNVLVGEPSEAGHPAHAFFTRRYDTIATRRADTLQAAVGTGELGPDTDCAATAQEILAVMDGHQIQWALVPDSVDMAQRLRTHLDRLYHSPSTTGARLPAKALPD